MFFSGRPQAKGSRQTKNGLKCDNYNDKIKIATINIEGLLRNENFLYSLMKQFDIVLIQEHWLHNFETGPISETLSKLNFNSHLKCYDDSDPISMTFRPHGVFCGKKTCLH